MFEAFTLLFSLSAKLNEPLPVHFALLLTHRVTETKM